MHPEHPQHPEHPVHPVHPVQNAMFSDTLCVIWGFIGQFKEAVTLPAVLEFKFQHV